MKRWGVAIAVLMGFSCGADVMTLPPPEALGEADFSFALTLPERLPPSGFFRVKADSLPENAQLVVAFGDDRNEDGVLDAEEVDFTLDSDDETVDFRLPEGVLPAWTLARLTLRGASEPVMVRIGVTAPALKLILY